ncbi:hypothetical protein OG921_00560 [Aldersonia sp. NBC_00410]|uniref:hypothetical protein n=1 Tax=Aldersonia sp. NBC_00410 TaxID=2975954 RepID=UPI00225802B3|nr:hypothetical protein [Aldersonia sp. NBC_00410]MCX5041680.1 hypothetical protein [Aldersonia sp. NBC_00410]
MARSDAPGRGANREALAMTTVLVGFAESFAAIEATWSLQRSGMRVIAFARHGTRPPLRFADGVELHRVPAPEADVAGCLAEVREVIRKYRPDAFLPLDDAALWLTRELGPTECIVAGPSSLGIDVALDKAAQLKAAAAAGLLVPDTNVVATVAEIEPPTEPIIIKPADAIRIQGTGLVRPTGRICASAAELAQARTQLSSGPLLVQPVIRGRGEGLFGTVGPSGDTPWSAHRRIRMVNPAGSASSACESVEVDSALRAGVADMLDGLGWRGLFMAEFLRDAAGRAWFMELNGRAWGSLALATGRGFEYPAWAVQDALALPRSPSAPSAPPHIRARHLGREAVHLAFVVRGPQSAGVADWPRRGRTVRDLLRIRRGDRVYNWNRRQPKVAVADTWRTLADQLQSLRRNSI